MYDSDEFDEFKHRFEDEWEETTSGMRWSWIWYVAGAALVSIFIAICCCRRKRRGQVLSPPPASVPPPPPGHVPYPQQQYTQYPAVTPYPVVQTHNTTASPYPTVTPYPAGGAPYPAGGAPYPTGGAPYPTGGAPYPVGAMSSPGGAPYPTGAPTAPDHNAYFGLAPPGWHQAAMPPSYEQAVYDHNPPYNPSAPKQ